MSIQEYQTLNHTKWECKYHIVFIPKFRKKSFFGSFRTEIGPVLRKLAMQYGCEILEGNTQPDHVHILISIPPKLSVSKVVGFIKGKSAIYVARHYRRKERNFTGENFWARGYFVSTVGRDELMIKKYIRHQEKEDQRQDQLKLTFRG